LICASAVFGAAVLGASASFAADLAKPVFRSEPPVAVLGSPWEGVYFGFGLGTTFAPLEISSAGGTESLTLGALDSDRPGSTGLQFLGINFASGPLIYGLEGELAVHETKDRAVPAVIGGFAGDYLWGASLRARAGYDLGRFMPYVSAGVIYNPLNMHFAVQENGALVDFFGVSAGAGLEFAWTPSLLSRLEYVYSYFGDQNFTIGATAYNASLQSHSIRLAMIFKEGMGAASGASIGPGRGGFYGGAIAGGGIGLAGNDNPPLFSTEYTMPGAELGVFGGYDLSFGNWFAGVEMSGRGLTNSGSGDVPGPAVLASELLWMADGRLRLGYNWGKFSPYLAGGFTLGQVTTRNNDPANTTVDLAMHYGGTGAVGLDYAISDRVFLRGEYAYSLYTPATSNIGTGVTGEHSLQKHDFRIGLGVRFGD
jgi:outer membrane immunogenic protein